MKGFELTIDRLAVNGAIEEGITSISIELHEDLYHVFFCSTDATGMITDTWYAATHSDKTRLTITLKDIIGPLDPLETIDHNNQLHLDKRDLETYFRLKAELIEEGIKID